MENFFSKPFNPSIPCFPEQYVNELCRLAMSIAKDDVTSEEIQMLRAISINAKASYEHHKKQATQPLIAEIADLKKQMKEKIHENNCLRALTDGGSLETLGELREQIKVKNAEIATWKTQFDVKLQENIKDLIEQFEASQKEVEHLRAHFETALETGILSRKFELEDEVRNLSARNEELLRFALEKKTEIMNLEAQNTQMMAEAGKDRLGIQDLEDLELANQKYLAQIEHLRAENYNLNAQNSNLFAQIKDLESKVHNTVEIEKVKAEIADLEAQNRKLAAQVRDLEYYERSDFYSAEHIEMIDARIRSWQKERETLLDKCAQRMKEAGVFKVEALQEELEKLQYRDSFWKSQLKDLTVESARIMENQKAMDMELRHLRKDKETLMSDLKVAKCNYDKSLNKIDMLNVHIERLSKHKKVHKF